MSVLGSLLLACAGGPSPLLTGLVSYWSMEGNANDALGNNNASATSITFNSGNGKIGQGAGFTGSSSAISAPASSSLDIVTDMTIGCWLNTSQHADYYTVVAHMVGGGGVNGVNYNLIMVPSGQISLHTQSDVGPSGGPFMPLNTWTHLVVTRDTSGNVEFYVNGSLYSTGIGNPPYSKPTATTTIGCRADAYSYWHGALDEVGIWSRKLTPSEVSYLYNGGAGKAFPL